MWWGSQLESVRRGRWSCRMIGEAGPPVPCSELAAGLFSNFETELAVGRCPVLLTSFTGQYMIALDCAARSGAPCSVSCVERSDRSEGPVRPVAVQNDDDPTNARPGGTPSGQVRASLNAMETRRTACRGWKSRVKRKSKEIKDVFLIDSIVFSSISRDPLYLYSREDLLRKKSCLQI